MAHHRVLDLENLVALARDKSRQSRTELFSVVGDLFSDKSRILTDEDRSTMADILRTLINDVEMSVQLKLAERLAERPDAPSELVVLLANHEIAVAHPILVKSEVLRDEELIEIIQHRAMEHQVAIASRMSVSTPVSEALVATSNETVIERLLGNQGAEFSPDTMEHLVETSHMIPRYQEPLVRRHDLSPELAKRLYSGVSAALREHIVENFYIDPDILDETLETAIKGALGEIPGPPCHQGKQGMRATSGTSDDTDDLLPLIRDGDIAAFVARFSNRSGLHPELVRQILFEPGGERLAIVCRAIDLDKHNFVWIFMSFRVGRLGDKQVDPDEISKAVPFFDRIDRDSAEALLRYWRSDPADRNTLRQVDQI